jgi:plasmid stabilization system protein ParE
MVVYKVAISTEAKQSIQKIFHWVLEQESKQLANKVVKGILDQIENVSIMPNKHPIVFEIINKNEVYRWSMKWAYKIIFIVDESEKVVRIIDVIHSKRNPKIIKEIQK